MAFGIAAATIFRISLAVGATLMSRLLDKHQEYGYVGLVVIVWVAGNVVLDGGHEVIRYFSA